MKTYRSAQPPMLRKPRFVQHQRLARPMPRASLYLAQTSDDLCMRKTGFAQSMHTTQTSDDLRKASIGGFHRT